MNRKARKRQHRKMSAANRRWKLTIDSQEAAVNFYSILHAFQKSGGGDLIDAEALAYVKKWIGFITQQYPGVVARANDSHGPFRVRDTSPQDISLELNERERALMLYIWRTMYMQLITPSVQEDWIRNQGRLDYELAVKNYQSWINSLEGEGYMSES